MDLSIVVTAVVAALSLLGWVATLILRLSVDEFELPITVVCAIVPCFSAALALVLGAIAGGRGGWLSKTLNAIGACIINDDYMPSISALKDVSQFFKNRCVFIPSRRNPGGIMTVKPKKGGLIYSSH